MDKPIIFMLALVCVIIFAIGEMVHVAYFGEDVIIEGKVTDVELREDGIIIVTFNNNSDEIYYIEQIGLFGKELDFTVNSKIIVKLYRDDYFLFPDPEYWHIDKIIKISD